MFSLGYYSYVLFINVHHAPPKSIVVVVMCPYPLHFTCYFTSHAIIKYRVKAAALRRREGKKLVIFFIFLFSHHHCVVSHLPKVSKGYRTKPTCVYYTYHNGCLLSVSQSVKYSNRKYTFIIFL